MEPPSPPSIPLQYEEIVTITILAATVSVVLAAICAGLVMLLKLSVERRLAHIHHKRHRVAAGHAPAATDSDEEDFEEMELPEIHVTARSRCWSQQNDMSEAK
eukprot:435469-Prymnesium_polylepis.2